MLRVFTGLACPLFGAVSVGMYGHLSTLVKPSFNRKFQPREDPWVRHTRAVSSSRRRRSRSPRSVASAAATATHGSAGSSAAVMNSIRGRGGAIAVPRTVADTVSGAVAGRVDGMYQLCHRPQVPVWRSHGPPVDMRAYVVSCVAAHAVWRVFTMWRWPSYSATSPTFGFFVCVFSMCGGRRR